MSAGGNGPSYSKAPLSHLVFCGRVTPRASVSEQGETPPSTGETVVLQAHGARRSAVVGDRVEPGVGREGAVAGGAEVARVAVLEVAALGAQLEVARRAEQVLGDDRVAEYHRRARDADRVEVGALVADATGDRSDVAGDGAVLDAIRGVGVDVQAAAADLGEVARDGGVLEDRAGVAEPVHAAAETGVVVAAAHGPVVEDRRPVEVRRAVGLVGEPAAVLAASLSQMSESRTVNGPLPWLWMPPPSRTASLSQMSSLAQRHAQAGVLEAAALLGVVARDRAVAHVERRVVLDHQAAAGAVRLVVGEVRPRDDHRAAAAGEQATAAAFALGDLAGYFEARQRRSRLVPFERDVREHHRSFDGGEGAAALADGDVLHERARADVDARLGDNGETAAVVVGHVAVELESLTVIAPRWSPKMPPPAPLARLSAIVTPVRDAMLGTPVSVSAPPLNSPAPVAASLSEMVPPVATSVPTST